MKIDFKNPTIKNTAHTLIFYLSAIILFFLLNCATPSGPDSIGFGFFVLILLPFFSLAFFLVNLNKSYKNDRSYRFSTLIHFIVLIAYLLFFGLCYSDFFE